MFKAAKSTDRGKRTVAMVEVSIVEFHWADGTSSFEVYGENTDYTELCGPFDSFPTDEQIENAINDYEDWKADEGVTEKEHVAQQTKKILSKMN